MSDFQILVCCTAVAVMAIVAVAMWVVIGLLKQLEEMRQSLWREGERTRKAIDDLDLLKRQLRESAEDLTELAK